MKWPMKKLGEVCDFKSGLWTGKKPPFKKVAILRNTNFRNGGYLDLSNVAEIQVEKKQLEERILKRGDLILERSGGGPSQPVGRVVYFDEDGIYSFSNFTTRIRVKNTNELDSEYLWRYLNKLYALGVTETLQKQTTGIRNLNFPEYKKILIPLPPVAEQKRIVAKIEKLFAKIDQAERWRQEAAADAAALLPSALQQVFSRQKWPMKKLGEVTILNPKKSEIKDLSNNKDVSFVPMAAVNENTQTITNNEIRKLKEVKKGFTYFKNGDVIFAKITPCMENGKIAIARDLINGIGFGSTEFHVIRPTDKILPEWIFTIVRSQNFRDEAEKHMTGTAGQQRVPVEFLKNAEISLPPIAEQKRIVAYLDSISQKAQELQNLQRQTAADFCALRQSILANAFA